MNQDSADHSDPRRPEDPSAETQPGTDRENRLIAAARDQLGSETDRATLVQAEFAASGTSLPADAIPGYEIIREIHRGGQGVVYQALQKATKRKVAIKVMREGPFGSAREKARFEREVQILAQLKHPNIVSIHDSGVAAGHFFFVMDYISGQALDAHMNAAAASRKAVGGVRNPSRRAGSTRLSRSAGAADSPGMLIEDTLRLFAEICEAVSAAHLRGVIHRDLKPGNIRVDENGKPHVLDFGLARTIMGDGTDGQHPEVVSVTGQFMGSLPWASPEQAEAIPAKIDIRTDVYSLGVILYQMLTSRFPYDVVGNMRDVLDRILLTEPARPSTIRRQIDDEVETIVLKCLSKERERRYQSAGELARDIRRYLAGEPIEAKRDSGMYVLRKQLRRYRIPIAVAAAIVMLVVAAGVVSIGLYAQAQAALREARLGRPLGRAEAGWAAGLAAVDQSELNRLVPAALRTALDRAAEAERTATAGQNERATAFYNDATAALRNAVDAAATARSNAQVEVAVAQLERALADKARLDAEGALGRLDALAPRDGRLAAWRAKANALAWPKSGSVDLGDGVKLELLLIPAGSFKLGSSRGYDDEKPPHSVTINRPFYMGKTEVTQRQWEAAMGSNPSGFKGADLPVESVSWDDCQAFCRRLSSKIGLTVRLPTEAEWEYACRAGGKGSYCFGGSDDELGQSEDELGKHAWYISNSQGKTHPVGAKQPNAWGLYDMHGNVWEWCEDCKHDDYKSAPEDGSAWLTGGTLIGRVMRGASWGDIPAYCRSANRGRSAPAARHYYFGLRVVVAAGTP